MNTASEVDCQRENEEISEKERLERAHSTPLKRFLWTLPQPIIVFGGMIAVALSITRCHTPEAFGEGADTFTALLLFAPPAYNLACRTHLGEKERLASLLRNMLRTVFGSSLGSLFGCPFLPTTITPLLRTHSNGLATSRLFPFHSRRPLYPD